MKGAGEQGMVNKGGENDGKEKKKYLIERKESGAREG
jgi:hypothetical protein